MRIAGRIPVTHIQSRIRVPGLHDFCKQHHVTYTPVIMKAIASVCKKYPVANSIFARDFLFQENIYCYEDVDMSLAIEKHEMGQDYATFAVIRKVNRKSIQEIGHEIKVMAECSHYKMPDAIVRLLLVELMPNIIKGIVIRAVMLFPFMYRHFFGTMGLSNLGKYGLSQFDTLFVNNFGYAIGGLEYIPITENGKTFSVPTIHITQTSNHCVADGAESARVMEEIKRVFESGDYIRICDPASSKRHPLKEKDLTQGRNVSPVVENA